MKTTKKKLALGKTTLRALTCGDLSGVAGATIIVAPTFTVCSFLECTLTFTTCRR